MLPRQLALAILLACAHACLAQMPDPGVVEAVAPVYPELAVTGRISGSVIVDIHVTEKGSVEGIAAPEGDATLRQAAIDAARQWRFQARSVPRDLKLIFSFRLMPKGTPEAQLGAVFRPPFTVEVRRASPGPVSHYARAVPPESGKR
ncbi:MAG TPA: energy transducer TonB [Bryobacteraceae bacterium]|nr:energy transducer TonB [Bryobacteraceae bacterium]